jgi:NAD(P)-dependent dehydrogenase (short-subunit alcohol dehydrogenase family)
MVRAEKIASASARRAPTVADSRMIYSLISALTIISSVEPSAGTFISGGRGFDGSYRGGYYVRHIAPSWIGGQAIQSLAIQADSADASAVVAVVERTVAELGGIDILVNNAGVFAGGPVDDFKLEDLDRTLAVNVRAALRSCCRGGRHRRRRNPRHDFLFLKHPLCAESSINHHGTVEEIVGMVA